MNSPGVVSDKTIVDVRRAMEDLGYQPSHVARSLVTKKTNTIGIVMPDIKNTFFNSWFRALEEYAGQSGYTTFLCNADEDPTKEMKFVRLLQAHRVDGVLIVPRSVEAVKYLVKNKTVTVLVDRMYHDVGTDVVSTDHYDGARRITEYLIGMGHERIGVLTGPDFMFPSAERYRGFCDAMKGSEIRIVPQFVKNCEFKEKRAYDAVDELLTGGSFPTAFFAFNSLTAIGAIKAINSHGLKIPDDISLVCYDEIPGNDIFNPKITHVRQPIVELGHRATRLLIDRIENPNRDETAKIFLKPELIMGESCMKLRRNS